MTTRRLRSLGLAALALGCAAAAGAARAETFAVSIANPSASIGNLVITSSPAQVRVARGLLPADQLDGPWRAAGRGRHRSRSLGMGPESLEGGAEPGQGAGSARDPVAIAAPQRVSHARPDPGLALARVVEQAGDEDVRLRHTVDAERRDDVEPVAAVGHVHGVEQRELRRREPGRQPVPLARRHAGADVGPELADLASPPGSRR